MEGVVTRDVADTAAVLDLISGPDRGCWYNAPAPERPFLEEVGAGPGRLRVGLIREAPLGLPIAPVCAEAAEMTARTLERLGHVVVAAELDLPEETVAAFLNVVNSSYADYEGIDWERAEPHVQAGRQAGLAVDSLAYVHAVHVLQRHTRKQVALWGDKWDVLVTPTMTIEPPRAGEVLAAAHGAAGGPALVVLQMALLTSTFNVSGQPAISLPVHVSESGLPIGVQIAAGPWEEALLLRVAAQVEEALPWADRVPTL